MAIIANVYFFGSFKFWVWTVRGRQIAARLEPIISHS